MTVIVSVSRGMRFGNESYLTGVDTITATNGHIINQPLLAATDDQAVALNFLKSQMVGMFWLCDQDATVHLRGDSPHDVEIGVANGFTVAGPPGEFTYDGDCSAWLWPGDEVYIEGATTPANDGCATVVDVDVAAGISTITITREAGAFAVEVSAGAGVTMWRKIQRVSGEWDIVNITAVVAMTFTVAGDLTDTLEAGDMVLIENSTTPANDGLYTIATITYAAPNSTITCVEAGNAIEAGAADTSFCWIIDHLLIRLTADIPFLWAGGGILSPVLEDITTVTADVAGATAADLQGRTVIST